MYVLTQSEAFRGRHFSLAPGSSEPYGVHCYGYSTSMNPAYEGFTSIDKSNQAASPDSRQYRYPQHQRERSYVDSADAARLGHGGYNNSPHSLNLGPPQSHNTIHAQPTQQARATQSSNPGWNSRSGIPPTCNLAGQTWSSLTPADSSQLSHSGGNPHLPPPGLPRQGYAPVDFSPVSTPGAYTPRTPQDYSPLPTPIARPQASPYGDAGPSATLPSAPKRRSSGKDEFDGPHQFLPKPDDGNVEVTESQLISLTISLQAEEQDDILAKVNDCLSKCAFDFVAKYQFPIPIEADKRPVRTPADREWTEWCHLLKRLATKRRIPMRVLWNGQIKQLVTVLENSLEMRHAAKHQSRPLKDDRNILQLISAGLQVAKMLKDPQAMIFLDNLYSQTEFVIRSRARSDEGFAAGR